MPTSQGNRGRSKPEEFVHPAEVGQDVGVGDNQGNSISHNSFNENRLYGTGQNGLKQNGDGRRSTSYNLQSEENQEEIDEED